MNVYDKFKKIIIIIIPKIRLNNLPLIVKFPLSDMTSIFVFDTLII